RMKVTSVGRRVRRSRPRMMLTIGANDVAGDIGRGRPPVYSSRYAPGYLAGQPPVRRLRAIWLTRYGECQKTRRGCRNRKRLLPGASGGVGLKRATGGPAIRNESVLRPRGRSDFPRGRSEFCRWRGGFLLGGRGKPLALLDPLGGWIPP